MNERRVLNRLSSDGLKHLEAFDSRSNSQRHMRLMDDALGPLQDIAETTQQRLEQGESVPLNHVDFPKPPYFALRS